MKEFKFGWLNFRVKVTLYPITLGFLFLINELRHNGTFYTLKEDVTLILIVLLFTLFTFYVISVFIHDKNKAALISTMFIFINLFYQDIFSIISSSTRVMYIVMLCSPPSLPEVIIIPALFIGWIFFSYFLIRSTRTFAKISLYLNVLLLLLVFFEVLEIFIDPIPKVRIADNSPLPINSILTSEQKPNIFYIVLDSYTSSESLQNYWNYDNSKFEESLKQYGFYIAPKSLSDFDSTPFCLASYLNSSSLVLDDKFKCNERNLLQLIRQNRLNDWLVANKYHSYNFSLFETFGQHRYYNYFYSRYHFLGRTIWYMNFVKLYHHLNSSSRLPQVNLAVFKEIAKVGIKDNQYPLFVYAHIMMPHYPYVYNREGALINSSDNKSDKDKYLDQLIFTNHKTLETVRNIFSDYPTRKIVIIQGDHGYRYLNDFGSTVRNSEGHTIFYGIYSDYELNISDTFNPSETFKILINSINNNLIVRDHIPKHQ